MPRRHKATKNLFETRAKFSKNCSETIPPPRRDAMTAAKASTMVTTWLSTVYCTERRKEDRS
jgi:hypothetical protein